MSEPYTSLPLKNLRTLLYLAYLPGGMWNRGMVNAQEWRQAGGPHVSGKRDSHWACIEPRCYELDTNHQAFHVSRHLAVHP